MGKVIVSNHLPSDQEVRSCDFRCTVSAQFVLQRKPCWQKRHTQHSSTSHVPEIEMESLKKRASQRELWEDSCATCLEFLWPIKS